MTIRRLLYSAFLYLVFPFVILRLLLRSRKNSEYRKRMSERLGFYGSTHSKQTTQVSNTIWVHTVSVGEAIAAKPLVEALFEKYPESTIVMTTTTPTGSDRVSAMFKPQILSNRMIHAYFPYDLLGAVSRFIRQFSPKILIVVETEIWPNLYANCHQQKIPVLIVNARLSEKSTDSYLKFKGLISETLSKVDAIAVRSASDEQRFLQLGAQQSQIKAIGNIKYDIVIDEQQSERASEYLASLNNNADIQKLVFVAASTHEGEDEKILRCFSELKAEFSQLLLVLIPRHPERFENVYEKCVNQLPTTLKVIKHSKTNGDYGSHQNDVDVILGDSMGEMQTWYAMSDVVFIGGSLVKTGGHNPLEATIFGVPVVSGPHMFNFEDIGSDLTQTDLLTILLDESSLTSKLRSLLLEKIENSNKNLYQQKADEFMRQHRGVTARLTHLVSKLV